MFLGVNYLGEKKYGDEQLFLLYIFDELCKVILFNFDGLEKKLMIIKCEILQIFVVVEY